MCDDSYTKKATVKVVELLVDWMGCEKGTVIDLTEQALHTDARNLIAAGIAKAISPIFYDNGKLCYCVDKRA